MLSLELLFIECDAMHERILKNRSEDFEDNNGIENV